MLKKDPGPRRDPRYAGYHRWCDLRRTAKVLRDKCRRAAALEQQSQAEGRPDLAEEAKRLRVEANQILESGEADVQRTNEGG